MPEPEQFDPKHTPTVGVGHVSLELEPTAVSGNVTVASCAKLSSIPRSSARAATTKAMDSVFGTCDMTLLEQESRGIRLLLNPARASGSSMKRLNSARRARQIAYRPAGRREAACGACG